MVATALLLWEVSRFSLTVSLLNRRPDPHLTEVSRDLKILLVDCCSASRTTSFPIVASLLAPDIFNHLKSSSHNYDWQSTPYRKRYNNLMIAVICREVNLSFDCYRLALTRDGFFRGSGEHRWKIFRRYSVCSRPPSKRGVIGHHQSPERALVNTCRFYDKFSMLWLVPHWLSPSVYLYYATSRWCGNSQDLHSIFLENLCSQRLSGDLLGKSGFRPFIGFTSYLY